MDSQGWVRGIMSKSFPPDRFFIMIMKDIEEELTHWGHETIILYNWGGQSAEVPVTFMIDWQLYPLPMEKALIQQLQKQSPYALDKHIWSHLKNNGIELQDDQYIRLVFNCYE